LPKGEIFDAAIRDATDLFPLFVKEERERADFASNILYSFAGKTRRTHLPRL
jgi:hypothetical protein